MISLRELEIVNFRSWEHLHLTNMNKPELILIQGDNGSGKSSIRQAIEYLLLDTTSESIALPELPRNKDTECILRCVLSKDDDVIEIKKYRNSNEFGNKTILTVNDVDLSRTDRRETQKIILSLLDVTPNSVFASTIFSPDGKSFCDAKESDRKKILYDTLNLTKFDEYHERASEQVNLIKSEIEKGYNNVEMTETSIKDVSNKIEELTKRSKSFEDNKTSEIATQLRRIKELKVKNISKLEEHIYDLQAQFVDEIDDDTLKHELEFINDKLNKLQVDRELIKYKIDQLTDNVCPILNTECDLLVQKQQETLEENSPKLQKVNKKIEELESIRTDLHYELDEIQNIVIANAKIQSQIDSFSMKIDSINSYNKGIETTKQEIEDRIKYIAASENQFEELIIDEKKRLRILLKSLQALKVDISDYQEKLKLYSFWKIGFSKRGIPNMKSDSFLIALEKETNNILSSISDRISVSIESQATNADKTVREKIAYKVIHPDKSISDFHSYSSGEKHRIKLADILAFNNLIGQFNFVILDEILEMSLDSQGKSAILDILGSKYKSLGTTFVISNDDTIKTFFNKVYTITKKDGISTLRSYDE